MQNEPLFIDLVDYQTYRLHKKLMNVANTHDISGNNSLSRIQKKMFEQKNL